MNDLIEFDLDEIDYLQELLNVAFGDATSVISNMLDTFATLHIPKIKLLNIGEVQNFINKNFDHIDDYFVFSQQFRGDMEGEAIFISNQDSIKHLSLVLNDDEEDLEEIEDMIDLASEMLNIVNSATIKRMAKELSQDVFFRQPSVKSVKSKEIVSDTNISQYKTVIVVSTILDFEKEDIKGTLYVLLKPKSIEIIKTAVEDFFDEEC
ncbi:MAG: hypothetical protein U9O56_10615 [Campylobacterota bacterium]|nr:hypothetical protein [Campylobacterota bacterium]